MININSSINNLNNPYSNGNSGFTNSKTKIQPIQDSDKIISTGRYIGGFSAGLLLINLCKKFKNILLSPFKLKVQSVANKISDGECQVINTAINNMIKETGLEKHGVEIFKVTPPGNLTSFLTHTANKSNVNEVVMLLKAACNKTFTGKLIPDKYIDMYCKKVANSIANGKNAGFAYGIKKVFITDKLLVAGFHELGHAMNANLGGIGKILHKSRRLSLLTIPVMIIALTKNKKQNGEKPQGFWDKLTSFVKNNAGKLTFLALLPKVLEEGFATLRGNKFAKQYLSPELFKKVAKVNALGFSTYLVSSILAGVGIYAGTKLRDTIVQKKRIKSAQQV